MRKIFALLMVLTMLTMGSIHAFAEETQTDKTKATFNIPKMTMFDDLYGKYDLTSTLRMTFPDVCFEDNVKLIDAIISGERSFIIKEANAKEISYLYASRLYLLPLQLKAYDYEMYKIGMINPYFDNLVASVNSKPTSAKQDLLQMQILNYNQLGIMQAMY